MSVGLPPTDQTLEDRIYEAALLPELWRGVLDDFVALTESDGGLVFRELPDASSWLSTASLPDELLHSYYSHPGATERLRRLFAHGQSRFVRDEDVFSPQELLQSSLHRDFLIPRGLGRGIATVLALPNGESIVIHAERRHDRAPISDSRRARLEVLRPHLARSAMLASRLSFHNLTTAVQTLDALGLAACAVDRRGKVVVANAAFAQAGDYLSLRGVGPVAISDRGMGRHLLDILGTKGDDRKPASLPLPAGLDGRPAVLHVIPVIGLARDLFTRASAILVLSQAGRGPLTDQTPLLRSLFDLTEAEGHVAQAIVAGQTVAEIAAAKGTSPETVRAQLKAVMAKSGCHRQADLVRVLSQLLAP